MNGEQLRRSNTKWPTTLMVVGFRGWGLGLFIFLAFSTLGMLCYFVD